MTSKACVLLLLMTASLDSLAAPQFEDYPAQIYQGRLRRVSLSDHEDRKFAAALRSSIGHHPNFAGRFVLSSWGCGASCVMSAAIDAKTGQVIWLPFTVSNWPAEVKEPLEFRRDSRLLIVRGSRNEADSQADIAYFIFDGQQFTRALEPDAK